eukprot:2718483-Amphidinium_carterae.1
MPACPSRLRWLMCMVQMRLSGCQSCVQCPLFLVPSSAIATCSCATAIVSWRSVIRKLARMACTQVDLESVPSVGWRVSRLGLFATHRTLTAVADTMPSRALTGSCATDPLRLWQN